MKILGFNKENKSMEFLTGTSDLLPEETRVLGKDGHVYNIYRPGTEVPNEPEFSHLPVYTSTDGYKMRRRYTQDEFRMLSFIDEKIWDCSYSFMGYKNGYERQPVNEDEVRRLIQSNLDSFMWGGKLKDIHYNEFNEIIADCTVDRPDYSPDGRVISAPTPHDYQFMVQWEYVVNLGLCIKLYPAQNDKREPTFPESLGLYDETAPESPYILYDKK